MLGEGRDLGVGGGEAQRSKNYRLGEEQGADVGWESEVLLPWAWDVQ